MAVPMSSCEGAWARARSVRGRVRPALRPIVRAAAVLLVLLPVSARDADAAPPVRLTRAALTDSDGVALREGWRYRPGDDPSWADPMLDDAGWEAMASPRMFPGAVPQSGWTGIGWFRYRLGLDQSAVGMQLGISLDHPGASDVFVDGVRVGGFGTVAATASAETTDNPAGLFVPFRVDRDGEHVIAIRYSCASSAEGRLPRVLSAGFNASVGEVGGLTREYAWQLTLNVAINAVLATLMLAFGVLHLLLFTFHRDQRANLYYGAFGVVLGLLIVTGLIRPALHIGYEGSYALVVAGRFLVAGTFLLLQAFLSSALSLPRTWRFRLLLWLWPVAIVASLLFPTVWLAFYGINFVIGASLGEAMWTIGWALRKRVDGAWIIGLGMYAIAMAMTAQLGAQIFGIQAIWPQVIALMGFFGLPLSVSIFLARRIAQIARTLETKLVEVEELSERTLEHERAEAEFRLQREHERAELAVLQAENERKAQELEEARQLQLSMLPSQLPDLPGIEIAAYMKPATEVGGDYYDFHVGEDGTLTVAIGDATGHGLKAGTLVTATKGLFNAFAADHDIASIFDRSSQALRRLNLRYLYMALMMAKLKGNTIRVGAAGMPPMLVWRAATGAVEEISVPGLPLGGSARFPYREREIILSEGDTVVLMSDGFPERFNESGEIIDYARAKDILAELAGAPPQAIIERFVAEGDAWAGVRPQDDDITFVVLRFGPRAGADGS